MNGIVAALKIFAQMLYAENSMRAHANCNWIGGLIRFGGLQDD